MYKDTKQFGLARRSGTFLLDAGVANQRADKSSALAESRATCCLRSAKPICLNKLMETYHIRWSIEVLLKDAKQYLQLGKCQCNNFDSQTGATALAIMQYIMLLLYKQMHYGKSLGSIFDMLCTQVQEENISRYLLEIFWEIVNGIGEMLKIDCMDLFEEIIRDNQRAE